MKRLAAITFSLLVLVGLAGCGSSSGTAGEGAEATVTEQKGYRPQPTREVGELALADHAAATPGAPFALTARPGGLLLVYFGYLSCPDICPLTMGDTAAALDELGEDAARIDVAFVTVDLERDTGADIVEYMTHFFPVEQVRALLPASELELNGVSYEFGAQWSVEPHEPGEFYGVAHSGATYAVDDHGVVVWSWPFGTTGPELAEEIRTLLADSPATT
jgi:cytochrome oxidase Cu insertion factor (SCO1/SenC/PrrC family)